MYETSETTTGLTPRLNFGLGGASGLWRVGWFIHTFLTGKRAMLIGEVEPRRWTGFSVLGLTELNGQSVWDAGISDHISTTEVGAGDGTSYLCIRWYWD